MTPQIPPIKKSLNDFKNKKAILYWLILGAAVLAVGAMIWWEWDINSQINEPIEIPRIKHIDTKITDTSSWQVYQNEEYGFEVKYPNNYYLARILEELLIVPNEIFSISITAPLPPETDIFETPAYVLEEIRPKIFITIHQTSPEFSLDKWIDYHGYYGRMQSIDINNVMFTKGEVASMTTAIGYFVLRDERIYEVVFNSYPVVSKDEQYNKNIIQTFNQILSTFRFLD
jgi:hypothetical protein